MSIKDQIATHLAANEAEKKLRAAQVLRTAEEHEQVLTSFRTLRQDHLVPIMKEAADALQEKGIAASWSEGEETDLPSQEIKHAFARFAVGDDFVLFECDPHRKAVRVSASRAYSNNHVPQLGVEESVSLLLLSREKIDAFLMATISLVVR